MKSFKWIAGVALALLLSGLAVNKKATSPCQSDCCVEQSVCCPDGQ